MSLERTYTRQMLENVWRRRLEETQAHYHEAQERYRRLLEEQRDGTSHGPNDTVALARRATYKALAEYTRVLEAFTDLTVNGKIPEDRSGSGLYGV